MTIAKVYGPSCVFRRTTSGRGALGFGDRRRSGGVARSQFSSIGNSHAEATLAIISHSTPNFSFGPSTRPDAPAYDLSQLLGAPATILDK